MVPSGTFVQAYNCRAAVDEKAQTNVAADVTQDANEKNQTASMVKRTQGKEWSEGYVPSKGDVPIPIESKSLNPCLDRSSKTVA